MGALVLLSGGQDSATCLAKAMADEEGPIEAVTFDYGQRHRIELEFAQRLAQIAGVPCQQVNQDFISTISTNALTSSTIPITSKKGELPSTFVEGRNLFFLATAAVIAKQRGISTLYTGVCQTDYSGYPDCREDFIQSMQTTLSLALDYPINIVTPLMWLTKAETVTLMNDLGHIDWYAWTHTCYEGQRPACGQCPACQLRLKGFHEAGIDDPLSYKTKNIDTI